MSNKINVFACGGFGQNIVREMMQRPSFALLKQFTKVYALDTSQANIRDYANNDLFKDVSMHIVPEADGSGAFRGENNEAIATMVRNLVNSGDIQKGFNIVISSASGGSGAVIAGEMLSLLNQRGHSVVGMMLETDEDHQRITNTLKTVKTLQYKASQGNQHISVFWESNRNSDGRFEKARADDVFLETLEELMTVGHPDMGKLDTKDIHHFLQYPIRGTEPGELRFISVHRRGLEEEFDYDETPLAVLSLLPDSKQDPDYPRGVGYTTYGVLPKAITFTDNRIETQFAISGGKVAKLANHLETTINEYTKIQAAQKERSAGNQLRTSPTDVIDDSGNFL